MIELIIIHKILGYNVVLRTVMIIISPLNGIFKYYLMFVLPNLNMFISHPVPADALTVL